MYVVTQDKFSELVTKAIDGLPDLYKTKLDNVAFFVEQEPTQEQRQKMQLRPCDLLFGLYEGIPLTARGNNYNLVLPDKITIFKGAIELVSYDAEDVWKRVRRTIWHEVAHYYGLDHARIQMLEKKADTSNL